MAITGTGTELDPFIVHSYDEIKEKFSTAEAGEYYLKLANDIDCNNYGASWEWETIDTKNNVNSHLDLDGHTIKNAYIKNDNYLFKGYNSNYKAYISNGKLLNIFGAYPKGVLTSCVPLRNVSLSTQITTISDLHMFNAADMENCAIYAILLNGTNRTLFGSTGINVKNVDLYLEIYNVNSTTSSNAFRICGQTSGTYTIDSIRADGKIVAGESATYANTIFTAGKCTNSVFNVDVSSFTNISSGQTTNGSTSNNTTVINAALLPSNLSVQTGYLSAPSSQAIRTGSDLRSLGFSVINVEE